VIAVGIGIAITVLLFLYRMSKSVVRRGYRCDSVHSRKTRDPKQMEILGVQGSKIVVIELEGPIFFGTAEDLGSHIDSVLREDTSYVVFDLKRVNEIDSTGARIMLQTHERLAKEGKMLLLSSFEGDARLAGFLRDMGVTAALTQDRLFQDTDRAIEWAEDHLLRNQPGDAGIAVEYSLAQLDVFAHIPAADLAVVESMLTRRAYGRGEVIFREGDAGRELYVIAKGSASVRMRLPGSNRETRLVTFTAGTVFGEFALLDQGARSATIAADEDLVCYVLSHSNFEGLTRRYPSVAIDLLVNLGRELSGRLRRANRTIYQLES
jgi:SulP family sulfate permease